MVERKTLGSQLIKTVFVVILLILALSCILPLVYTLAVSFSSKAAVAAGKVALFPVDFTVFAYKEIMKDSNFFLSFGISIARVLLAVSISVMVMIMASYPLSKSVREFKPRNIVLWLFVFCMMFSGGLIPWYTVMKSYHLTNSIFGLAIAGGIPVFNMILVVNFFQEVPKELEEAAKVDGAGPWYILFGIVVPLSKPVIATVALFTIVAHWNDFFQGLILSTGAAHYPLQTYIKQLVVQVDTSHMTQDDYMILDTLSNTTLNAAKIFISMVPILLIYPRLQKYFVTGITLGGVKE